MVPGVPPRHTGPTITAPSFQPSGTVSFEGPSSGF
jgi:hypothetical protein